MPDLPYISGLLDEAADRIEYLEEAMSNERELLSILRVIALLLALTLVFVIVGVLT